MPKKTEGILSRIVASTAKRYQSLWEAFVPTEVWENRFGLEKRLPLVPEFPEGRLFLIAEMKKASPSQGIICKDYNLEFLTGLYTNAGADALSVLTEERFFQGSIEHLALVRKKTSLPLLRKDFIVHPYQVHEAWVAGADLVLLIAAILSDVQLKELSHYIADLGMTALIEVHNKRELDRALLLEPKLLGINNRDLRDFSVDLQTSIDLRPHVPQGVAVLSESGIFTQEDVSRLRTHKFSGMLVGQSLLQSKDIAQQMRLLKEG